MAETPAVCPALHLPVQSGSDAVLRRMKRQYTRGEYLGLVGRLRAAIPGLALSTDLIVGFPGETEEQFEETLSLLDEVRFAQHFAFTYSPRPGTAAARWESDVTPAVASRRLARLVRAAGGDPARSEPRARRARFSRFSSRGPTRRGAAAPDALRATAS